MTGFNFIKAGAWANSYASIEDADDYLESPFGVEDWTSLSGAEKEALLATATRQIDRLRVKYPSCTTTQRLKFPLETGRLNDKEGRLIGDGFNQAKKATILQALYLYRCDDEFRVAEANRMQRVISQKIGQNVRRVWNGYNSVTQFSPETIQILSSYIDTELRVVPYT